MTPDERRAAVVEVAIPLLREHGAGLTTRQVAEAAGIAEGTLFRAFGTKDDLVRACAVAVTDNKGPLRELAAIPRDQSLDDRLTASVAVMQRHVGDVIGVMVAMHSMGVEPDPSQHRRHRRPTTTDPEIEAALTDLIGEDAASFRLPLEQVLGVFALLTLSSVHPMFPARHMTPEMIVSVVLDGTRKTGAR